MLALLLPTPDDRSPAPALAAPSRRLFPPTEAVLFPLVMGREEQSGTSLLLSRSFPALHPKTHSATSTLRSPYPTRTQGYAMDAAHEHQPTTPPLMDALPRPTPSLLNTSLTCCPPPALDSCCRRQLRNCALPSANLSMTSLETDPCIDTTKAKQEAKKAGDKRSQTPRRYRSGDTTNTHARTRTETTRTKLLPLLSTATSPVAAAGLVASKWHGPRSGRSGSKHIHEHHKIMGRSALQDGRRAPRGERGRRACALECFGRRRVAMHVGLGWRAAVGIKSTAQPTGEALGRARVTILSS